MEGGVTEELEFADDDHQKVVGQFEEFADATITVRALAEKCRDYRDGNQYTDDERKTYKKRKQPCITDNKIQDKCDTLLGIEKQMRTDPKAYPRNPDDEDSAEAATDALRYVADDNRYHVSVRKEASDNLMVEGLCAGQVIVEKRRGRAPKILMEHIRWDRLYYDIHSLKKDFSDARYKGYFTWMDYDEALDEYPNGKDVLDASVSGTSQVGPDKSLDDKPRYTMLQSKRKRVQVFKHYHLKKGKWYESEWCRGGWLEKPKPCVYKDEDGQPSCCIEMQALYRDADGNPYGSVPRYLDLQDEHNKRRSKMLHLLSAKRIIIQKGQEEDIPKIRDEVHKPDGVVEVNDITQFKVEDNLAQAEGQWRLLMQTEQALSQTGPNSAIAGTSGDLSGIAKARDQQAGQLPISPLFDALDDWELRMYRQVWCRVRQYWTSEMWIRVTDNEDKPKFVGLNQQMSMGEQLAEKAGKDPQFQQLPPEEQQSIIADLASRPEAQQIVVKNSVGEMDVDVIIERGPDVATLQQEEFSQLTEIAKARPEVKFSTLVKMSQLRSTTKKMVLEDIDGANDPAAKQQAQFQQMMQQLQGLILQAQVRSENAKAAKDEAAATESQIDAAVKTATYTDPQPNEAGAEGAAGGKPSAGTKASVSVS